MNDAEMIFCYSRKEALDDGILIDVTDMATEAGFKYPVAITVALWSEYIKPSKDLESSGQSVNGRLWDMLTMLNWACRLKKSDGPEILFEVLFLMEVGKEPELVKLKSHVGPGDSGEPVITVMLPHED